MYPVFLSINEKPCVVVGGGTVALRKIHELLEAKADVTVIADVPSQVINELSEQGRIKLKIKRFEQSDIEGAFLAFAATDDSEVNAQISESAKRNNTLVNAVDMPELCDFFSGAVVKRGQLIIAISTSGCCPGIAGQIRKELEELFPESYIDYIEAADEMRKHILSQKDMNPTRKRDVLSWLARKETRILFFKSGKEKTWEKLQKLISS
ncbi:MAG: bifunctional precorrin-2 dehydrogenase/sirohydrochlorin ferrochelatase [Candidatus Latescibacteria bacterium]|jgi:precorrin-2 dehydrogenase / sirohydrochlorin ferrochelatase|nr:bifunctional precorrin-2 dehydrogenase/sirohydrochlorin ferrochelatase [Candidatus Latescibacterota bacterium]